MHEQPSDIPPPRETPKSSLRPDEGEVQAELKRIEAGMNSTNGAIDDYEWRGLYGRKVQKRLRDIDLAESSRRKVSKMPRFTITLSNDPLLT